MKTIQCTLLALLLASCSASSSITSFDGTYTLTDETGATERIAGMDTPLMTTPMNGDPEGHCMVLGENNRSFDIRLRYEDGRRFDQLLLIQSEESGVLSVGASYLGRSFSGNCPAVPVANNGTVQVGFDRCELVGFGQGSVFISGLMTFSGC